MPEAGDRSVALHEPWSVDVAQSLPDGDVLADTADRAPVHEVGDLVDGDTRDAAAVHRPLDRRGDGEVEAAGPGRCGEQQHSVAQADLGGGVEGVRVPQAVCVGVEERGDLGGPLTQEVRRGEWNSEWNDVPRSS